MQDKASQWVAAAVGAQAGERVADVCAAPGGKATALAATGAFVVAADSRPHRVHLIATNAERLPRADGSGHLVVVAADALRSPLREASFDRVLVDAPCSGLGVLHRRPDARWSRNTGDVDQLARLQRQLVIAALGLLRPGGLLVYSVCTLTSEETTGVDNWLAHHRPDLVALPPPDQPWQPIGRGARLLPQRAATDGMALFRYLVPDSAP